MAKPVGTLTKGSHRWHMEQLAVGETYSVSKRVDGNAGKEALRAARKSLLSLASACAYRAGPHFKIENGEFITASGDIIVTVAVTRMLRTE